MKSSTNSFFEMKERARPSSILIMRDVLGGND